MRIYHFCAERHLISILHAGIKIGGVCVPTQTGYRLKSGYIWLTLDGDREHQSWNTRNTIPYDRCARRLTIEIPDEAAAAKLLDKDQLEEIIPGSHVLFDGWPDSENWRVFRGMIVPEWITEVIHTTRGAV